MYVCKVIKKRQGVKGRIIFRLRRMQRYRKRRGEDTVTAGTDRIFFLCQKLCLVTVISVPLGVFRIEV
jgi:hypothetical protein